MQFQFGVMSSRWVLEAPDSTIAKIAMSLYIRKNIPIAIYYPNSESFMPKDVLMGEPSKEDVIKIQIAFSSIKKLKSNIMKLVHVKRRCLNCKQLYWRQHACRKGMTKGFQYKELAFA